MEESKQNLRRAYSESIQQLEDLRRLGGASLAPLASQLQYHLSGMMSAATAHFESPEDYPSIKSLIENQVGQMFLSTFPPGEGVQTISQRYQSDVPFSTWNNILRDLGMLLSMTKKMKITDIALTVEKDFFTLDLALPEQAGLVEIRSHAYAITQKLIAGHALLTYSIAEGASRAWLKLKIHYGESEHNGLSYFVDDLEFDTIFSHYETTFSQVKDLGQHHIIKIDKNGQVTLQENISEQSNFDETYIHLPFLFRPVSLIISGRGKLASTHARNVRVSLFDLFK